MVNLRQRPAAVLKKPQSANKRTSSRASTKSVNYTEDNEDVNIDSSESEDDIELSGPDNDEILDGYASSGESVDIDDEEDLELSGSEDDKEIQRIIEKTEAETRNIPLTARQRAKMAGGIDDPLEEKIPEAATALTDEQALRKSEKSRRRKLQRDAKMEETKRATIERLLQKQKKPGANENNPEEQADETTDPVEDLNALKPGIVRFIDNASSGPCLHFADPETFQSFVSEFHAKPRQSCHDLICQICKKNQSKYIHPRNAQPFCSISCYKLIK